MPTLLQRIAARDAAAVEACIDEYGGLIWRLASRYLDRARSDVEDAVQEVFIELWLSAHRYDPGRGSEAAFVATIAHRRLIDYQRRLALRRGVAVVEESVVAEVPPQLRALVAQQDLSQLVDAFDELPADERRALWLAIHGGLTHRQIGETERVPIGTGKTRLRRGLLRLRRAVAISGDEAPAGGGMS